MEIKVLEENSNTLLQRREFRVEIEHPKEASPKRTDVRKEFSKNISVPLERVIVEQIEASYGVPRSRGLIFAYANDEAVKKTVRGHILKRNGMGAQKETPKEAKEEKKEAAAPAASPPAAEKKKEG